MRQKSSILLGSLFLLSTGVFAQCKGFTKRQCLPALSPYISNGQMNAAHLVPGENAEVQLNFNKGLSYRLMVCADPYLEGTSFELLDDNETYLKDTLDQAYATADFKVKQTGPMKLSIKVPEKENTTGIVRNGCVTILIGFKE